MPPTHRTVSARSRHIDHPAHFSVADSNWPQSPHESNQISSSYPRSIALHAYAAAATIKSAARLRRMHWPAAAASPCIQRRGSRADTRGGAWIREHDAEEPCVRAGLFAEAMQPLHPPARNTTLRVRLCVGAGPHHQRRTAGHGAPGAGICQWLASCTKCATHSARCSANQHGGRRRIAAQVAVSDSGLVMRF